MTNKIDNAFIQEALTKGNYVSAEDMKKALEYGANHHSSFVEYLIVENIINKELIGQAVAEALNTSYFSLNVNMPSKEIATKIPKPMAEKLRAILVEETDKTILVVSDSASIDKVPSELGSIFPNKKITAKYSLTEDIDEALSLYKEKLNARFVKIIQKEMRVAPEIVEQIIEDAIALKASDIHLEPQDDEVVVRFRIDGVLDDAGSFPKSYYENIVNRIKIESRLRIDEHMRTQDGAIRFKKNGVAADLRVSIIPTLNGEKIVMRLLSEYLRALSLGDLGLTPEHQAILTEVANRPYGMILAVGPTGSGKTTTLYAVLKMLNEKSVNITTIEDPVEYRIPRVNQVQVNERSNLTFVNGLRTIVRQDPDIILVGEIRDLETAEIAVNASLTGHLLLTTFHANDAATVIPRLLDMKIEPFMLASTLMIILAQRLVRKICPHCKVSEEMTSASLIKKYPKLAPFLKQKTLNVYHGKGCAQCGGSGFKSQIGIFEFITISSRIQELVLSGPSSEQIAKIAREEGSSSFFEDGLKKVQEGVTTYEELLRVALPPSSPQK